MAGFNLTAQINLVGPTNVKQIASQIRKDLGNVNATVKFKLDPSAAKNVASLNSSLKNLNKTLGATNTLAQNASTALSGLARSAASVKLGNIPRQINQINQATTKLNKNSKNISHSFSGATSEIKEFGKQAALAVRRFTAFTTVTGVIYGLTNSINQGIRAYIEYDRELVRLQQVTNKTASGLSALQNEITRLSTSLGVSSKDLTTVSVTLAQAGLSARDTEKALQALARSTLAPSFDDLNNTVEGSIALMRQFGISAGELEAALGSVNSVAAAFAVEAGDIIAAIQRTGGVFATASKGVSEGTDALNEFIAVFTSVRATTRESAETIATGLRTIFTRIQRGDTINALKQFGVNLTDAEGKFVGAYKAVELLSNGLSKLDPRDLRFSEIVEELGGFRQIGKVIPLIQQFATAQEALAVAQQGQGSLAKDAATAQLSLSNQITKVREEFLALFRSIGQSQGFQTIVRGALTLTSALIKLADAAKTLLPALAVITAFKGAKGLTEFAKGFVGGIKRGPDNKSSDDARLFASGGKVRYFARGGVVPGTGNRDTVPAMLQPGEFVIRKKAVETIGAENLHSMNKYGSGGSVISGARGQRRQKFAKGGPILVKTAASVPGGRGQEGIASYYDNNIQERDKIYGNIDRKQIGKQEVENFYKAKGARLDPNTHKEFAEDIRSASQLRSRKKNTSDDRSRLPFNFAKGFAFEDFMGEYLKIVEDKQGYSKSLGKYDPLDFVGGGNPIEVRFRDEKTSNATILAKRLRYAIQQKESLGFTPAIDPGVDVGSTTVYEVDPTYKKALRLQSGGQIQKFLDGGWVKRMKQQKKSSLVNAATQLEYWIDKIYAGKEEVGYAPSFKGGKNPSEKVDFKELQERLAAIDEVLNAPVPTAKAKKSGLKAAGGYEPEELLDAVKLYQGGSGPLTRAMANQDFIFIDRKEQYDTEDIVSRLQAASQYKTRKKLYSGLGKSQFYETLKDTGLSENDISDQNKVKSIVGKTIDFPTFLSTSYKKDVATAFVGDPGAMMEISTAKAKTAGIDVNKAKMTADSGKPTARRLPGIDKIPQEKLFTYDDEDEFILPPNTAFKIKKASTNKLTATGDDGEEWDIIMGGSEQSDPLMDLSVQMLMAGGKIQKFAIGGEAQSIADKFGFGKPLANSWWTGNFAGQDILFDWASPTRAYKISDGSKIDIDQNLRKPLRDRAQREWLAFVDQRTKERDAARKPLSEEQRTKLAEANQMLTSSAEQLAEKRKKQQAEDYIRRTEKFTGDFEPTSVGSSTFRRGKTAQERRDYYAKRAQKYMAGGVAEESDISPNLQQLLDRIAAVGGPKTATELAGYPSGSMSIRKVLNKNSLLAGKNVQQAEAIVAKAEEAYKKKQAANQSAINAANEFALVGAYPIGYSKDYGPEDIGGRSTFFTARGLPSKYQSEIDEIAAEIRDLPSRAAEKIQMKNIFGTGTKLAFDFDETLVTTDPSLFLTTDGKNIDVRKFDDLQLVQEGLKSAQLTKLGEQLRQRLGETPELLDSIRVLTARPQSNAPYIASQLQQLGINIPTDKVTGVSGAENKIKNIADFETLVDDRLATIQQFEKAGKSAIHYEPIKGFDPSSTSGKKAAQVMEGYAIESLLERLGVPIVDDDDKRAIDFPDGLGSKSSIWGVKPNVPTDIKRTMDGDAFYRFRGEIERYYKENATRKMFGGKIVDPKQELSIEDKYRQILSSILPKNMLTDDNRLKMPSGIAEPINFTKDDASYYLGGLPYKTLKRQLEKNKETLSTDEYNSLKSMIDQNLLFEGNEDTISTGNPRHKGVLAHETFHDIQGHLYDNYPEIIDKLEAATLSRRDQIEAWYKDPANKEWAGTGEYRLEDFFPDPATTIPAYKSSYVDIGTRMAKKNNSSLPSFPVLDLLGKSLLQLGKQETIPVLLSAATVGNKGATSILSGIFGDAGLKSDFYKTLPRFATGGGVKTVAYGGRTESPEVLDNYWKMINAGIQEIKTRERQNQDKARGKDYGRVSLREDGSSVTATYMKDSSARDGFVTASKYMDNLYTIGLSRATKGYGPRLYDIVMETVTSKGGMLTSDRSLVSGDAKKVWDFYFKNRSDVKKTPLDPKYWTKNSSLIDPKLYGKEETWPPPTDPAWVLQSGYSKSPNLINDPEMVTRSDKKTQSNQSMALDYFSRQRFAVGGSVEDTVPALLTPGEFVINKKAAQKIGYGQLNRLNKADKIKGYNKGGAVGGVIQRFATGGMPDLSKWIGTLNDIMSFAAPKKLPQNPTIEPSIEKMGFDPAFVSDVKTFVSELNKAGYGMKNLAYLINQNRQLSIAEIEQAASKDLERLKQSTASVEQIIAAEKALASIRDRGIKEYNKLLDIQETLQLRNAKNPQVLQGLNVADIKNTTGAMLQAIRSQAEQLIQSGGDPNQAYLNATSRITGQQTSDLEDLGITNDDIQQYIAKAMKDRKVLSEMDDQLIVVRKAELQSTTEFQNATFAIQKQMLADLKTTTEEEISERRRIINELAAQSGDTGPGAGGLLDFNNSPILNQLKERYIAQNDEAGVGFGGTKLNAKAFTDLAVAIGLVTGQARNLYDMFRGINESSPDADRIESARIGGGFESAGTMLSTGLVAAGQALMIPVIGPYIAGITALGTAALAASDMLYDWSGSQEAAAAEMEKAIGAKRLMRASDNLSDAFDRLNADTTNLANVMNAAASIREYTDAALNQANREARSTREAAETRTWGQFFMFQGADVNKGSMGQPEWKDFAVAQSGAFDVVANQGYRDLERLLRSGFSLEDIRNPASEEEEKQVSALTQSLRGMVLADRDIAATYFKMSSSDDPRTRKEADTYLKNQQATFLENNAKAQAIVKTIELERAMEEVNRKGRQLAESFDKLTSAIDQSINRIQFEAKQRASLTKAILGGIRGQMDVPEYVDRNVDVLSNPSAYSQADFDKALDSAVSLIPDPEKANMLRSGAIIETRLGPEIEAAIKGIVSGEGRPEGNANLSVDEAATEAKKQSAERIDALPVTDELKKFLKEQANTTIDAAKKKAEESKSGDQLRVFTDEVNSGMKGLANQSREAAKKLLELRQAALNAFNEGLRQSTEALLKEAEYRRKAANLRRSGDMNLREALFGYGESFEEASANLMGEVAALSGGLTDPRDISDKLEKLTDPARVATEQQKLKDGLDSDDEATRNKAAADFQKYTMEVNNTRAALDKLADSAELAEKALAELKNLRGLQQDRLGFADKLLTNTPEEADNLNQAFIRLQRNLSGGLNFAGNQRDARKAFNETLFQTGSVRQAARAGQTVLANQRKETLQLLNDPGFRAGQELSLRNRLEQQGIRGEQQNQIVADQMRGQDSQVRRQMAIESGMINNPLVQQSLRALEDPRADESVKRAADNYLQSIGLAATATEEQARLEAINSTRALTQANIDLKATMDSLNTTMTTALNNLQASVQSLDGTMQLALGNTNRSDKKETSAGTAVNIVSGGRTDSGGASSNTTVNRASGGYTSLTAPFGRGGAVSQGGSVNWGELSSIGTNNGYAWASTRDVIAAQKDRKQNRGELRANRGGQIRANTTGGVDNIDAKLTDKEFVVNAKSAVKNLDLLHAINSGKDVVYGNTGGLYNNKFDRLDVNLDSVLTRDELPRLYPMKLYDRNGDGGLSREEFDIAGKTPPSQDQFRTISGSTTYYGGVKGPASIKGVATDTPQLAKARTSSATKAWEKTHKEYDPFYIPIRGDYSRFQKQEDKDPTPSPAKNETNSEKKTDLTQKRVNESLPVEQKSDLTLASRNKTQDIIESAKKNNEPIEVPKPETKDDRTIGQKIKEKNEELKQTTRRSVEDLSTDPTNKPQSEEDIPIYREGLSRGLTIQQIKEERALLDEAKQKSGGLIDPRTGKPFPNEAAERAYRLAVYGNYPKPGKEPDLDTEFRRDLIVGNSPAGSADRKKLPPGTYVPRTAGEKSRISSNKTREKIDEQIEKDKQAEIDRATEKYDDFDKEMSQLSPASQKYLKENYDKLAYGKIPYNDVPTDISASGIVNRIRSDKNYQRFLKGDTPEQIAEERMVPTDRAADSAASKLGTDLEKKAQEYEAAGMFRMAAITRQQADRLQRNLQSEVEAERETVRLEDKKRTQEAEEFKQKSLEIRINPNDSSDIYHPEVVESMDGKLTLKDPRTGEILATRTPPTDYVYDRKEQKLIVTPRSSFKEKLDITAAQQADKALQESKQQIKDEENRDIRAIKIISARNKNRVEGKNISLLSMDQDSVVLGDSFENLPPDLQKEYEKLAEETGADPRTLYESEAKTAHKRVNDIRAQVQADNKDAETTGKTDQALDMQRSYLKELEIQEERRRAFDKRQQAKEASRIPDAQQIQEEKTKLSTQRKEIEKSREERIAEIEKQKADLGPPQYDLKPGSTDSYQLNPDYAKNIAKLDTDIAAIEAEAKKGLEDVQAQQQALEPVENRRRQIDDQNRRLDQAVANKKEADKQKDIILQHYRQATDNPLADNARKKDPSSLTDEEKQAIAAQDEARRNYDRVKGELRTSTFGYNSQSDKPYSNNTQRWNDKQYSDAADFIQSKNQNPATYNWLGQRVAPKPGLSRAGAEVLVEVAQNKAAIEQQRRLEIEEYERKKKEERDKPGRPVATQMRLGGMVYASSGGNLNDLSAMTGVDFKPKGVDRIPAMLAEGEFVINANSTAKNLPLLKAINNDSPLDHILPRYAHKGGLIYRNQGSDQPEGMPPPEAQMQQPPAAPPPPPPETPVSAQEDAQSNTWFGSSNPLVSGLGYLGGVAQGVGDAVYGGANVVAGGIATVASPITGAIGYALSDAGPVRNSEGKIKEANKYNQSDYGAATSAAAEVGINAMAAGAMSGVEALQAVAGQGPIMTGEQTALQKNDERNIELAGGRDSFLGIATGISQNIGYAASQGAAALANVEGAGVRLAGRAINMLPGGTRLTGAISQGASAVGSAVSRTAGAIGDVAGNRRLFPTLNAVGDNVSAVGRGLYDELIAPFGSAMREAGEFIGLDGVSMFNRSASKSASKAGKRAAQVPTKKYKTAEEWGAAKRQEQAARQQQKAFLEADDTGQSFTPPQSQQTAPTASSASSSTPIKTEILDPLQERARELAAADEAAYRARLARADEAKVQARAQEQARRKAARQAETSGRSKTMVSTSRSQDKIRQFSSRTDTSSVQVQGRTPTLDAARAESMSITGRGKATNGFSMKVDPMANLDHTEFATGRQISTSTDIASPRYRKPQGNIVQAKPLKDPGFATSVSDTGTATNVRGSSVTVGPSSTSPWLTETFDTAGNIPSGRFEMPGMTRFTDVPSSTPLRADRAGVSGLSGKQTGYGSFEISTTPKRAGTRTTIGKSVTGVSEDVGTGAVAAEQRAAITQTKTAAQTKATQTKAVTPASAKPQGASNITLDSPDYVDFYSEPYRGTPQHMEARKLLANQQRVYSRINGSINNAAQRQAATEAWQKFRAKHSVAAKALRKGGLIYRNEGSDKPEEPINTYGGFGQPSSVMDMVVPPIDMAANNDINNYQNMRPELRALADAEASGAQISIPSEPSNAQNLAAAGIIAGGVVAAPAIGQAAAGAYGATTAGLTTANTAINTAIAASPSLATTAGAVATAGTAVSTSPLANLMVNRPSSTAAAGVGAAESSVDMAAAITATQATDAILSRTPLAITSPIVSPVAGYIAAKTTGAAREMSYQAFGATELMNDIKNEEGYAFGAAAPLAGNLTQAAINGNLLTTGLSDAAVGGATTAATSVVQQVGENVLFGEEGKSAFDVDWNVVAADAALGAVTSQGAAHHFQERAAVSSQSARRTIGMGLETIGGAISPAVQQAGRSMQFNTADQTRAAETLASQFKPGDVVTGSAGARNDNWMANAADPNKPKVDPWLTGAPGMAPYSVAGETMQGGKIPSTFLPEVADVNRMNPATQIAAGHGGRGFYATNAASDPLAAAKQTVDYAAQAQRNRGGIPGALTYNIDPKQLTDAPNLFDPQSRAVGEAMAAFPNTDISAASNLSFRADNMPTAAGVINAQVAQLPPQSSGAVRAQAEAILNKQISSAFPISQHPSSIATGNTAQTTSDVVFRDTSVLKERPIYTNLFEASRVGTPHTMSFETAGAEAGLHAGRVNVAHAFVGNHDDDHDKNHSDIKQAQHHAKGGLIYANNGKLVDFSPKGEDKVPAMLARGEYVINRDSTADNLPLLKAINNDQPLDSILPMYAKKGGLIPDNELSAARTELAAKYNSSIPKKEDFITRDPLDGLVEARAMKTRADAAYRKAYETDIRPLEDGLSQLQSGNRSDSKPFARYSTDDPTGNRMPSNLLDSGYADRMPLLGPGAVADPGKDRSSGPFFEQPFIKGRPNDVPSGPFFEQPFIKGRPNDVPSGPGFIPATAKSSAAMSQPSGFAKNNQLNMADIANSIYNNMSANPQQMQAIARQQGPSSGSDIIQKVVSATNNIASSKQSASVSGGQGGVLDTDRLGAIAERLQETISSFGDSVGAFSESGSSVVAGFTKTAGSFGQVSERLASVSIPETVNFSGSVQTEHKFNGAEAANNVISTLGPQMKQQTSQQLGNAFNRVNRGVGPLDAGVFGPDTQQIMRG